MPEYTEPVKAPPTCEHCEDETDCCNALICRTVYEMYRKDGPEDPKANA